MLTVQIANTRIGQGEPCFIIAEAGVNHNGNINSAKELIRAARRAGASAVKFQAFKTEELVTRGAEKAPYQKQGTGNEGSQFEMIQQLELTERDFEELLACAQEEGIIFLSSAFDKKSVDLLDRLRVPTFKVGSGEITNLPLLKHIAGKKKPVILSTGMATLDEIEEALAAIRQEGVADIVLLHCVSCYPARVEEVNLRAMDTLGQAFGLPVGLSDHTLGITIPIAAVALGACAIEKHFTLNKNLPGPDHRASLEPGELEEMIKSIREVEAALGDGMKRPTVGEEENKGIARRSIVARVDIPASAIISQGMLAFKRPGTGVEPKYADLIVGKKAKDNIQAGELITFDKLL